MPEQRKVKVMTTIPNGIELSLREIGKNARYPGLRVHVPGSQRVQVGGEFAVVDEDFMKAWLQQNEGSQLVKSGALVIVGEDEPAPVDNIDRSDESEDAAEPGVLVAGEAGTEADAQAAANGAEEGKASEETAQPQSDGGDNPADDQAAQTDKPSEPAAKPNEDGAAEGQAEQPQVSEGTESDKPTETETNGAEEGKAS